MTGGGGKGRVFDLESRWHLDASIPEIYAVVRTPESLASWWSSVFMRAEFIEPGGPDLVGLTVRLYTKGLLPHTFQFAARVVKSDLRGAVEIEAWGDFIGRGEIRVRDAPGGVDIRIRWRVLVRQPYIRPLLRLLALVFAANHRWAMRRGREGLQAEIHRRRRHVISPPGTAHQTPSFPHNLGAVQRAFRWTRSPVRWSG